MSYTVVEIHVRLSIDTVHEFPKNPTIVRVNRANLGLATPTTNSQAVICEAHFDGNCYSTEVLRMAELSGFGVKKIKIVVPGTVPDNYAHTVMIPPPTPVSRRQCSVGGPVGVAVRGVRAASPINTTDRHTHSRSRRKDRIVPSLKLLEYVYILYKILVVVIFSFQSVVF